MRLSNILECCLPKGETMKAKRLSVLFISILVLLSGIALHGAKIKGKVIRVEDGDTIKIALRGKSLEVRFAGADCPEKGQAYYEEAKEFTRKKILGKLVNLEIISYPSDTSFVARVRLEEFDMSLELIKNGLAWYDKKSQDDKKLAKAQKKAKKSKTGLWSKPTPAAPWVYRQSQTAAAKVAETETR
jgi:endonuclease YncB( thermonuclease family)